MPRRITTTSHDWLGAAVISLTPSEASHANLRQSVRVPGGYKTAILEVYCGACRRPFDDVSGEECPAAESNAHLIGGPSGRRRRHDVEEGAVLVAVPA